MMQVLKEFNNLLNRRRHISIGVIENVDAAVTGKPSPELLKIAIELALAENLDIEDVTIMEAESFDYGYKLEVTASYMQDKESHTETYYINHAILY